MNWAERRALSEDQISKIERGKSWTGELSLALLANALGVTQHSLFDFSENDSFVKSGGMAQRAQRKCHLGNGDGRVCKAAHQDLSTAKFGWRPRKAKDKWTSCNRTAIAKNGRTSHLAGLDSATSSSLELQSGAEDWNQRPLP